MKDVKAMALKHLIEKLVAMPHAKGKEHPMAAEVHEEASPFSDMHDMHADEPIHPVASLTAVEIKKKKA